jgi:transketolase
MSSSGLIELKRQALPLRRLILESVNHAGAGHVGGPHSALEILIALYFKVLRIDPENPGIRIVLYFPRDILLSVSTPC